MAGSLVAGRVQALVHFAGAVLIRFAAVPAREGFLAVGAGGRATVHRGAVPSSRCRCPGVADGFRSHTTARWT